MSKAALTLTFVTLVVACAGKGPQQPGQPVVAIGSEIQLNINTQVLPDQNGIFIQNHRLVSTAQIDKYQIYCSVLVDSYQRASEPLLKIEPGIFKVSRVRLYNDYVYSPTIYANNDDRFYYPSTGIEFRTEIHLASTDQPRIRALTCTNFSDHYQRAGYYPALAQFEEALGDLARLQ